MEGGRFYDAATISLEESEEKKKVPETTDSLGYASELRAVTCARQAQKRGGHPGPCKVCFDFFALSFARRAA